MKKYYDKILFLLGLVVAGIGAGIFFYKGGVPKPTVLPGVKLTGSQFQTIPAPDVPEPTVVWDSPPNQREDFDEPGWIYSIFTPPKIYWQDGEGWIVTPPSGDVTKQPFGVTLTAAKKDLYRIQLQGVSGKSESDPNDVINFSDEETNLDFHLVVGAESVLHQVKVTGLTMDRVEKPHGEIALVAKVTILDERTNQAVVLTQGEAYSPTNNQYYILQVGDPYPPQEWHVTAKGDKKELPGKVSFVVTDLDFDKPSVTVEKHSISHSGKDIISKPRMLTLTDESAPPAQPTPAAKSSASSKPNPVTTSEK